MPPKRFPKKEPPIKKPPPMGRAPPETSVSSSSNPEDDNQNAQESYEEELAWCVHRLKLSLDSTRNLTPRQAEDIRRNLNILENPHESVVKKRCIMKMSVGDYRQLMKREKQKISLGLKNTEVKCGAQASGHFKRKSCLVQERKINYSFQPSDNSFRFNFVINQE